MAKSPASHLPIADSPDLRKKRFKNLLTKQFYLWHWISSAICLAAMLLFTFTGLTLNHAADISSSIPITPAPPHTR